MKKIFLSTVGVLALITVFFSACKHENLETISGDSICFERDILPIFVSNCAMSGCHDAVTRAEKYDLSNYTSIMRRGITPGNPDNSEIWKVIVEGEMPPNGALTREQKSYLKSWIAAGAKNGTNCTVQCDSNVYSYSGAISKIMSNCTGCHSGTNASAQVDLSNHAGVKAVATNGRLMGSVTSQTGFASMPPYGSPRLTPCQITQLQKWINNGCQND